MISINPISSTNNNYNKTNFKGYFACPIKEVHIQTDRNAVLMPFIQEYYKKCKKYFDILVQNNMGITSPLNLKYDSKGRILHGDFCKWGQDNKLFLDTDTVLVLKNHPSHYIASEFAKTLSLQKKETELAIQGGNCFLGKKTNGTPFALIGNDALEKTTKDQLAKTLNVSPKNLYVISQPDFHLDMVIRPLNYPYVLVADPELTVKMTRDKTAKTYFEKLNIQKADYNAVNEYSSSKKIANELKKHGLKPIFVPGLLGLDKINFLNAVVHVDRDGKLIYITNTTNLSKKLGLNLEQRFRNYLKKVAPQIKQVIFIDGKGYLSTALETGDGGIHCHSGIRPDFNKWQNLINKD